MSEPKYIDAEDLMRRMYNRAFETDGDTMWQSGCWVRYRAIEAVVKETPAADVVEVRHGRWIKKYRGNYLCSVCGAWYRTTDDYGNIIDGEMTANYCESCGAKMDEVEE